MVDSCEISQRFDDAQRFLKDSVFSTSQKEMF